MKRCRVIVDIAREKNSCGVCCGVSRTQVESKRRLEQKASLLVFNDDLREESEKEALPRDDNPFEKIRVFGINSFCNLLKKKECDADFDRRNVRFGLFGMKHVSGNWPERTF